jgi:signal transduction histidine kinase
LAVLKIADTGVGIDAENLPHLFDRFYRAEKERVRQSEHTGLGLAICKAIVDADGGSTEIISRPAKGTTVTVGFLVMGINA